MPRHERSTDERDLGEHHDMSSITIPPPPADATDSSTQLISETRADSPGSPDESNAGQFSYYTGEVIYLARREFVLRSDETDELETDPATTSQPESIFLAVGDDKILRVDKLPSLINEPGLIRELVNDIIGTTEPMSDERAVRLGYLSDQLVDFAELRERCGKAVKAAFEAADDATWGREPGPPAGAAKAEEDAADEPEKKSDETSVSLQNTSDEPRQRSYCCYVALTMAARILDAATAQEMIEAVRGGANLDDLIFNIEAFRPPTESQPWQPDVPDKQGYHHVYALLGCLMATAYVNQSFAIETVYLDRAISNLDVAILKMPNNHFREFREYLQEIRKETRRIQILLNRIELEDDPWISHVTCAICLEFKPIIGFHETDYPYHKMSFRKLCQNALMRCKFCTLLRDATASLYPLLDESWADIAEISYSNRSVGRRWYGKGTDNVAEMLWGAEGALQIFLRCYYFGGEEASVSGFELYHSPGTTRPWDIIGTGAHVQAEVNSPDCWEMINDWIKECVENHDNCKGVSEDRPFPTRLVDVGADDTEPHLYMPGSHERGKYIALSHCWGDVMPLKTTKDTFGEFCRRINLSRFPQTFKDAIIVCRKLQIRYLWIDSLCIIQDDDRDWAVESPKMCDVYQNAYITIAAAAARNSSEGLFHPRPFSVRKPFSAATEIDNAVEEVEIFARPWQSDWHWTKNIGDGPLNRAQNPLETRAWTLQEHILSRRILRFTAHELVWHCREVHLCECRPESVVRKEALRLINLNTMATGRGIGTSVRSTDPYFIWLEVVAPFTSRAIMHETDRLPAISGVAAALSTPTGMEYIAGTWKDMLGTMICWHVYKPGTSRHETYYAPTWSWASVIGPVETRLTIATNQLPQTKVIDVQYTLATPNPYGRVSSAKLTMKGIMVDVSVTLPDPMPDDKTPFRMQFLDESLTETQMELSMDLLAYPDILTASGDTPELPLGDTIHILLLATKLYGKGFDSMLGILLTEVPSNQSNNGEMVYRKVGTGEIKLRNSDRERGEFMGTAEKGLAWFFANHLAAQDCTSTVIIV
ncbi:hypothetical protein NM208_g3584 [Fusarium decemcellulare]|uniref:Uncharacterized protein n=1 Tax=Fusarium decemcellulare TaxID=57161 RepID=A0ACC1SNR3_9HYPO|nr:hypothetical protein NM208_g3584 [Fusarium decemcellulare]